MEDISREEKKRKEGKIRKDKKGRR